MSDYNYNNNISSNSSNSGRKHSGHGWKIAVAVLSVMLAGALVLTGFTAGALFMKYAPGGLSLRNATPAPTAAATAVPQKTPETTAPQIGGTNQLASNQNFDIPAIVKADGPAVVGVLNKSAASGRGSSPVDELQGSGSGVIITADGYIVTNNHVVEGADSLAVVLSGGEELPAKLVGTDAQTDLAVLKVEKTGLTPIPFGNSDNVQVGEPVVAIGNPLGQELAGTVTSGIISAKDRELQIDGYKFTLLQTDAAINPGNSGGALVNAKGELIGINNLKSISAGTDETGMPISAEGIGFAIPINVAQPIIQQLMQYGGIQRPMLGISPSEISKEQADFYKVPEGVGIRALADNGPAMKAGLRAGDIIVEFGGQKVKTLTEMRDILNTKKVGDTVKIKVFRSNDSKEYTFDVTLGSSTDINN